ncbi:MAG TPA: O-antigen ligase family protein [Bryobacteraceae bacterium]|nr:O-antigen ligase family protein [Bryobacteraceae bacterium]
MNPTKLNTAILGRTALVIAPAALLLAGGKVSLACYSFYGVLAVILLWDIFRHRHLHPIALMIACLPMLVLLRGRFFYSGPLCYFGLALAQAPLEDWRQLRRNRLVLSLLIGMLVYWLATFAYVGSYYENYRALELAMAATAIYLLGQHRLYLRPALLAFVFSALGVALSLLPAGAMIIDGVPVFRLGLARVEGRSIGNPIVLGTNLAMALLLTLTGSGAWLGLDRRPRLRLLLQLALAVCLLLTTSRGSWGTTLICACVILCTEPRQRPKLLLGAIAVVLIGAALMAFTHDNTLTSYIDRTFTGESSLTKLTTGRDKMWESFPAAFSDAPFFGHGPGTSLAAGRIYFGRNLIYHALYLQVGVELGTFGLVCLFTFLYVLAVKAWRFYRLTGDPVGLVGAIGYMALGLSIPAFDAASGCLLGLGLIASDLSRFVIVSQAPAVPYVVRPLRVVTAEQ